MSRLSGLLIPVVLASAFVSGSAWSEDKGASRERESLRRAQQQVKQIGQEKAALEEKLTGFEQDKAKLLEEKEKLIGGAQARVKTEIAKREQLQLALNAMTQEKATLQSQKAEVDQRLAELTAKQAATERELHWQRCKRSKRNPPFQRATSRSPVARTRIESSISTGAISSRNAETRVQPMSCCAWSPSRGSSG